jgi:deoxycytidine triphosphate deaminase
MGIVPFVKSGPNRSVVFQSEDFEKSGRAILIRYADQTQFPDDNKKCNATYDLHVGDIYRDHRNDFGEPLPKGASIKLLPGNAVIIRTEEEIEFPSRLFGQILPRVSLLQTGIANIPSKVDPGYSGYLLITAFNHGKRTEFLERGAAFCSLHLVSVDDGIVPYEGLGKEIEARSRVRLVRVIGDFLDSYSGWILALTLVAALIALFK